MSFHRCCVPNCNNSRANNTLLHVFPNPDKDLNRFNKWINAVGGDALNLPQLLVFKYHRICHAHFEPCYHTRSKRLSRNSVPTLNLPDPVTHSFTNLEKQPRLFEDCISLGEKDDTSSPKQFKKKRVLNGQFANECKVRYDSNSAVAVPTLNLHGADDNVTVEDEMETDNRSGETVRAGDTTDFDVIFEEGIKFYEGDEDNIIEAEVELDNCSDGSSVIALHVDDTEDKNHSANINILEHNYSLVSKPNTLIPEDDPVYNVTTKCYLCNVKIATQYNLHCSKCKHIFDLKCLNMTNDIFKNLTRREKNTWVCVSCAKQDSSDAILDKETFVTNIYKRVKESLDLKSETKCCPKNKTLKRDVQSLKYKMNKFSNILKQKTKEYDRLLKAKDVEICRLKEIVAELQNCIAKK